MKIEDLSKYYVSRALSAPSPNDKGEYPVYTHEDFLESLELYREELIDLFEEHEDVDFDVIEERLAYLGYNAKIISL